MENIEVLSKLKITLEKLRLPTTDVTPIDGCYKAEYNFIADNKKHYMLIVQSATHCEIWVCDIDNNLIFNKYIDQSSRIWLHKYNREDGTSKFIQNEEEFRKLINKQFLMISEQQVYYIIKRDNKVKELNIGY
jgi:hypothetical protein